MAGASGPSNAASAASGTSVLTPEPPPDVIAASAAPDSTWQPEKAVYGTASAPATPRAAGGCSIRDTTFMGGILDAEFDGAYWQARQPARLMGDIVANGIPAYLVVDTWLKGEQTGMDRTPTPLHYYDLGTRSFAETTTYPFTGARPTRYHFGDRTLSTTKPAAGATSRSSRRSPRSPRAIRCG
ncbi:hypothetical protein [Actinoallomurus iriomotensis]|uniref:Uncharacterized protein n=1 Tax=Actinoallomurus iriomotensis TaxID=478107 RepID=A0A9W6W5U9_9ACTN|nr:hypothetical protein [Actinoallomurus iriomotensis]GLY91372.1 hypothetical protein Airi02_093010 [Actinoallomurus iriomotensis]